MKESMGLMLAILLVIPAAMTAPDRISVSGSEPLEFIRLAPHQGENVCEADSGTEDYDRSATHATVRMDPDQGGTITLGRYTLVVPPHALTRSYAISLRSCERNGIVGCELHPHGLTFNLPVTLEIDLSGTDVDPYETLSVSCWSDDSDTWNDVGGVFDPATGVLTTNLNHFSSNIAHRVDF